MDRLRFASVDLSAITGNIVAALSQDAVKKDIQLELQCEAAVHTRGSADLIGIMLRNVIDNAIRYSPPGAQVTVKLEGEPDVPTLSVQDNGPGIAPQDRSMAFDRFHRLHGGSDRGAGLGLSIVRAIAQAHGADVELGEPSSGKGLRVSIRFSRHPEPKTSFRS